MYFVLYNLKETAIGNSLLLSLSLCSMLSLTHSKYSTHITIIKLCSLLSLHLSCRLSWLTNYWENTSSAKAPRATMPRLMANTHTFTSLCSLLSFTHALPHTQHSTHTHYH